MRSVFLLVIAGVLLVLTACGSGDASSSDENTMPNVTGKKLDVAESEIEKAGLDPDTIKFIGGGALGPVVKSNWQVCAQSPAAGTAASAELQLTIERSCAASTASSTTAAPAASTPSTPPVLTAKNNRDLALLLKVPDNCSEEAQTFATKYAGRSIEFDGSVAGLINHGSYTTRYDITIAPGDKGPESTRGPIFKYEDVNLISDLNIKGTNPGALAKGDKLHLVAEVGEYNATQCLFALDPVSTEFR